MTAPDQRRQAPATARNRDPIASVLGPELPARGTVLEIASGTGEHVVHFARMFPHLHWQPSDPDAAARQSIAAWVEGEGLPNVEQPLALDASAPDWPVERADAIICINMVHISPWTATEGLFSGAVRLLPSGGLLYLYGPYIEGDVETAESNLDFDASLRSRNPDWGLRRIEDVAALGADSGFSFDRREAMPANNLSLIFRRT